MIRIVFLILSLALVSLACASPSANDYGWYVNDVLVSDEPWRSHDGPLLALLFITDEVKAEALYDFWNTEAGNVPIEGITTVAPGVAVETVVVFAGCEPDDEGNCAVWGTASVVTGAGRVLAEQIEVPIWVGRPPPQGASLGISEHGVGTVTDRFAGSYTFRMVVTDRVAEREVPLVRELVIAQ